MVFNFFFYISLKVTAYVQIPARRDTLAEKHVTKIWICFTISAAPCISGCVVGRVGIDVSKAIPSLETFVNTRQKARPRVPKDFILKISWNLISKFQDLGQVMLRRLANNYRCFVRLFLFLFRVRQSKKDTGWNSQEEWSRRELFFFLYFADRASQYIYLFININQLDALNFRVSLF